MVGMGNSGVAHCQNQRYRLYATSSKRIPQVGVYQLVGTALGEGKSISRTAPTAKPAAPSSMTTV